MIMFHLIDGQNGLPEVLGSGFQNPKLSPQAVWAPCDGSARLRLFGLGSPGFRALGRAFQTTIGLVLWFTPKMTCPKELDGHGALFHLIFSKVIHRIPNRYLKMFEGDRCMQMSSGL